MKKQIVSLGIPDDLLIFLGYTAKYAVSIEAPRVGKEVLEHFYFSDYWCTMNSKLTLTSNFYYPFKPSDKCNAKLASYGGDPTFGILLLGLPVTYTNYYAKGCKGRIVPVDSLD